MITAKEARNITKNKAEKAKEIRNKFLTRWDKRIKYYAQNGETKVGLHPVSNLDLEDMLITKEEIAEFLERLGFEVTYKSWVLGEDSQDRVIVLTGFTVEWGDE